MTLPVSAAALGLLPEHGRAHPRARTREAGGGGARYGVDHLVEAEAEAEVARRVSDVLAREVAKQPL